MKCGRLRKKAAGRAARWAGFTLVKLVVVMPAILALLLAIAVLRVIGYLERSKVKIAEIQLAQIESALDLYRVDVGDFPSEAQGLHTLIDMPDGIRIWNGPYLNRADAGSKGTGSLDVIARMPVAEAGRVCRRLRSWLIGAALRQQTAGKRRPFRRQRPRRPRCRRR